MPGYSVSVDVAASPDRVWDIMIDVDRWPEWTPSVSEVKRVGGKPFAVGNRVMIKQPKFPKAFWEVTDIQPSRSFSWVSATPGMRVTGIHAIQPTATGCRVTLTIDLAGFFSGLFWRLTQQRSEEYVRFEAGGLKARAESGGGTA